MSDGLKEALTAGLMWDMDDLIDLDIDEEDPWNETSIISIIDELNRQTDRSPLNWLSPVCECGAEIAKTTHARYCPKYRETK